MEQKRIRRFYEIKFGSGALFVVLLIVFFYLWTDGEATYAWLPLIGAIVCLVVVLRLGFPKK